MIFQDIDVTAKDKLIPLQNDLADVEKELAEKSEAVRNEDSKRREAEMVAEIKVLQRRRRELWGEMEALRGETFQNLLADEYGFPRTHPKFGKVYSYAYQQGHGSGYSDVEIYFSEIVDIVKD
jgi:hypothetical protein